MWCSLPQLRPSKPGHAARRTRRRSPCLLWISRRRPRGYGRPWLEAQEEEGDAGQSGAEAAAPAADAEETSQGGVDGAALAVTGVDAGQGNAASAAQPDTGGETGGGAQERPADHVEVETLVLEPLRAGVEGVTEEESAPRALAVEETCVPEPAGAQDDGVVAVVTAQTAP